MVVRELRFETTWIADPGRASAPELARVVAGVGVPPDHRGRREAVRGS